ncbi:MAG: hypothetical protein J5634_00085 [Bacilli bacterium]|nr:hypothetical protein [Bacilli bacterium]
MIIGKVISQNILSFTENLKNFLSSLTAIDIIFFFAVILLMILLVSLLYFIKSNEDYSDENNYVNMNIDNNVNQDNKEFNYTNSFVENNHNFEESIKNNYDNETSFDNLARPIDEEGELLDLESITKALENKETNNIDLTSFEEEQERDAIISYDELLRKQQPQQPYKVSYKKEMMYDDLSVKEVDLDSLSNPVTEEKHDIKLVSYEEEEAFLEALKSLQKSLN